jgi:Predicted NADH:ubiquinone oxidoreductase, subunit RnfA
MNIINIIIANVFINNYVFSRFLGTCPFLGVSNKMETATGMGVAVTFVTTLASVITFIIQKLILETAHIEYLQTIVFILVIASLVQFVELVLKKDVSCTL